MFYQTTNLKNQLEEQIAVCTKEKDALTLELDEYEFRLRRENSAVNSKNKELKALEIAVGRKDVKLDHLLNTLNESYNITYERALTAYPLELEVEEARMKVGTLKKDRLFKKWILSWSKNLKRHLILSMNILRQRSENYFMGEREL